MQPTVKLHLTPLQFVAIHEILYNVRLGDRNEYETAISELMSQMEKDGAEAMINNHLALRGYDLPSVGATYGNDEFAIVLS